MKVLVYGEELYHSGILGMKWGRRRWQYEDGTLTPEGRIRYRKDGTKRGFFERRKLKKLVKQKQQEAAKMELKTAVEEAKEEIKPTAPKKISEMSNEELDEYIARKTKEKNAYSLNRDIATLNPPKQTLTDRVLNKAKDAVVDQLVPEAVKIGKNYLSNKVNDALKLNVKTESESSKLKREASDWQNKYNALKYENDYNDQLKRAEKLKEKEGK